MYKIVIATLLFLVTNNSYANSSLEEIFQKYIPTQKLTATPQGFRKIKNGVYKNYIDGYEVRIYTDNSRISAVMADKNFNAGDILSKQDSEKYEFQIFDYFSEKLSGKKTIRENKPRSYSIDAGYNNKCHYSDLGGKNNYLNSASIRVEVSYWLGDTVRCDNLEKAIKAGKSTNNSPAYVRIWSQTSN